MKFTSVLREKLRSQRGQPPVSLNTSTQLKLISKRNVEIRRSYELSCQGIIVDPAYFEPETTYIRRMRLSSNPQLKQLYENLLADSRKIQRTLRLDEDLQLARIVKYSLMEAGEIKGCPKQLEGDRYSYQ